MGLIVGALLMTAGTAFAEDIVNGVTNLVGKTIQGQFPVTVDGETIEMPAIVVDGTSFLPVRKFAETVGYAVYFDPEGEILLEMLPEVVAAQAAERQQYLVERQAAYEASEASQTEKIKNEEQAAQIQQLQEKIVSETNKLLQINDSFDESYQIYLNLGGEPELWETSKSYLVFTGKIAEQQAIIDQLHAELSALQ
jgi:hypothetical protein